MILPYCGKPPAPPDLWRRWNLDPVLVACLLAALALYLYAAHRAGTSRARQTAFAAGWATAALALVSPLCALSVSLFSARVGQHMILALAAAPLVVAGRPGRALAALAPRLAQSRPLAAAAAAIRAPAVAGAAFTLAVWFWHAPGPYDATFASTPVYWLMHLSVFGTALMVWHALLAPRRPVAALAVGAVSTLQMTLLGALITLTPRLLYAPHEATPYAWGLTQAGDQQLGGLIMWVPGCTVFLAFTLLTLAKAMGEPVRRDIAV